ncbi:MAG: DUF3553 domain-containing protein [Alphaproteobacteria bacterium]
MDRGFAPGDRVRHPAMPEWGIGTVQSAIGARVTVTFEHAGKQLIDTTTVLLIAAPERGAEPAR